ncbi:hypothetical protein WSM22_26430 [Cytophagales bacterium WSM2-2]|nr:hypothetical protein WSM22_26430 [Cytophagales bacterium WSM2-2]
MVLIESGTSHLRIFALVVFVLAGVSGQCQETDAKTKRHQLTFTCDNDFLLFKGEDGYYTNGVFIRYDRISVKPSTAIKRIYSYELGQMIYTAHSRKILPTSNPVNAPVGIDQIDRPIAGYLYGKVTRTTFYNERTLLALGVSLGSTGDNSFGKDVLEFWHRMIGVKDYWNWVWNYQVKSELGINLHSTFARSLIQSHSSFQITPVTQATLGTTFTNLSQAVLFQFGKLQPMSSSSYWHSRLQLAPTGRQPELFLYYRPEIKYQVYNATIQGGMFTADKGPILSDIKPFVFSHEVGVRFSVPRYCIGYNVVFQSKEAASQFDGEWYASMMVAFRY